MAMQVQRIEPLETFSGISDLEGTPFALTKYSMFMPEAEIIYLTLGYRVLRSKSKITDQLEKKRTSFAQINLPAPQILPNVKL